MAYSAEYFTARESWRDWRIEARLLIALARVTPGARVLEIGCGGGGLLRMLRVRGASVVGVDTLDVALELARQLSLRAERSTLSSSVEIASSQKTLLAMTFVKIGKIITLPFRAASFDAIIGQHVIEHLPNVDAALAEWKSLLKPNGRIALATPNAHYPDPAHFTDADHAHIFSPDELRRACQRAGLIVESCYTIFPFLSRARILRGLGVAAYQIFQRVPYFALHGRTIMLGARLGERDE
jgi:2-polyprenyl-3-methyl-5-hydroxy-6-metoxy-1,4-benzoquinol methylase